MASTCTNARLRERSLLARLMRRIGIARHQNVPLPASLSDHMARDIGLDPNELERLRFKWPSQEHRLDI